MTSSSSKPSLIGCFVNSIATGLPHDSNSALTFQDGNRGSRAPLTHTKRSPTSKPAANGASETTGTPFASIIEKPSASPSKVTTVPPHWGLIFSEGGPRAGGGAFLRRRVAAIGFHRPAGAAFPEALGATCATAAPRACSGGGDAFVRRAQQEACRPGSPRVLVAGASSAREAARRRRAEGSDGSPGLFGWEAERPHDEARCFCSLAQTSEVDENAVRAQRLRGQT